MTTLRLGDHGHPAAPPKLLAIQSLGRSYGRSYEGASWTELTTFTTSKTIAPTDEAGPRWIRYFATGANDCCPPPIRRYAAWGDEMIPIVKRVSVFRQGYHFGAAVQAATLTRGPVVLLMLLSVTGINPTWAQTVDPWLGRWELNVPASKWSPGPGVRRESSILEALGDDGLLMVTTGLGADGREFRRELRGRFDGKEYPVEGADQPTMRSFRRLGANSFEYMTKVGGGVTTTVTTVSADGRTRTSVTTGRNARGEEVHDVQLRERR